MFRILLCGDPVALVGIVMSVAMSLLLDVTDAASGVESLLAGLAGSTLSLVLDSLVRAERRLGYFKRLSLATSRVG
jgi:hypothetical protein